MKITESLIIGLPQAWNLGRNEEFQNRDNDPGRDGNRSSTKDLHHRRYSADSYGKRGQIA